MVGVAKGNENEEKSLPLYFVCLPHDVIWVHPLHNTFQFGCSWNIILLIQHFNQPLTELRYLEILTRLLKNKPR